MKLIIKTKKIKSLSSKIHFIYFYVTIINLRIKVVVFIKKKICQQMPSDSDIEVNSDVNASGQKLVFESSVSSTESDVGGVINDCFQDSDPEDMEIIEMVGIVKIIALLSCKS